jgi:WD40 repeat protein
MVLHGHTDHVYSIAFTPNSRLLLSSSEDKTLRVWDVESGQCVRVIQNYAVALYDIAWSPDGCQLASAGSDLLVTIWDVVARTPPRVLRGHSWTVYGVAWSPDDRLLASCGRDDTVRLWDASTGACLRLLLDPDALDTFLYGIAWSPDGKFLASGSYQHGVQVWEVTTGTRCWAGREQHSGSVVSCGVQTGRAWPVASMMASCACGRPPTARCSQNCKSIGAC